jgi:hypothetical protein
MKLDGFELVIKLMLRVSKLQTGRYFWMKEEKRGNKLLRTASLAIKRERDRERETALLMGIGTCPPRQERK